MYCPFACASHVFRMLIYSISCWIFPRCLAQRFYAALTQLVISLYLFYIIYNIICDLWYFKFRVTRWSPFVALQTAAFLSNRTPDRDRFQVDHDVHVSRNDHKKFSWCSLWLFRGTARERFKSNCKLNVTCTWTCTLKDTFVLQKDESPLCIYRRAYSTDPRMYALCNTQIKY